MELLLYCPAILLSVVMVFIIVRILRRSPKPTIIYYEWEPDEDQNLNSFEEKKYLQKGKTRV